MAKEYYKNSEGELVESNLPKIKVYKSVAAAEAAIANGDLAEGEFFTTEFTGQGGDLAADIELVSNDLESIKELIPDDATSVNHLATMDDISSIDLSTLQPKELSSVIGTYTTVEGALSGENTAISNINSKLKSTVTPSDQAIPESEIDAKIPVFTLDTANQTLTITLPGA